MMQWILDKYLIRHIHIAVIPIRKTCASHTYFSHFTTLYRLSGLGEN